MRPLLLHIGVEPRKRIIDDLVLESAEAATLLTYRDTKAILEGLTKAETSKHRIHGYVQRVGSHMDRERRKAAAQKLDLMYADGTKAHGIGKKNEINVVVGEDLETGGKSLLGLTVNRKWAETAGQVTVTAEVLVSDADKAMRRALIDKVLNYQLCVRHAVKDVNTHLWKAELPKQERKPILDRLRTILRTLRNSARKHLVDKDLGTPVEDRLDPKEAQGVDQRANGGRVNGCSQVHQKLGQLRSHLRQAGYERGGGALHE